MQRVHWVQDSPRTSLLLARGYVLSRVKLVSASRLPEIYQKHQLSFFIAFFFFFLMGKSFVNKKAASAQKKNLKVGSWSPAETCLQALRQYSVWRFANAARLHYSVSVLISSQALIVQIIWGKKKIKNKKKAQFEMHFHQWQMKRFSIIITVSCVSRQMHKSAASKAEPYKSIPISCLVSRILLGWKKKKKRQRFN